MAAGRVISKLISPSGEETQIGFVTEGTGVVLIETKDLDLGERKRDKYIDALSFDFDSGDRLDTVQVSVGTRQRFNDPVVWYGPFELDNADEPLFADLPEGRYFKLKLEDLTPARTWKLSRIDFYGRIMGGRL